MLNMLCEEIEPFMCTLLYCFLEIDFDHSAKTVIKELWNIMHLKICVGILRRGRLKKLTAIRRGR